MTETIRIAMWSGPRNLSTAMMRSFGTRSDTFCVDEPFYGVYLNETGLKHPMREEILARHPTSAASIIHDLAYKKFEKPVFYQKHMTHHMIAPIPRDWFDRVRSAFLIRHPARVLASYAKKAETVSLADIGFVQQAEIFDRVCDQTGKTPVVIDSDDILRKPKKKLKKLCEALDIPFTTEMLSWQAGPKPEDGAWAEHWYDSVNASTGFGDPPGDVPELSGNYHGILAQALPIYERLSEHKI